jgi:hypothetical protein
LEASLQPSRGRTGAPDRRPALSYQPRFTVTPNALTVPATLRVNIYATLMGSRNFVFAPVTAMEVALIDVNVLDYLYIMQFDGMR